MIERSGSRFFYEDRDRTDNPFCKDRQSFLYDRDLSQIENFIVLDPILFFLILKF